MTYSVNQDYIRDAVNIKDQLNPALWVDGRLKPEVAIILMAIADEFQEYLGIDDLDIVDVTFAGSNAGYTYTTHSDIDLHLIAKIPEHAVDLYKELFDAKKNMYNTLHDIRIKGYKVELYVQDINDGIESKGIYSLMKGEWLSVPVANDRFVSTSSVDDKVNLYTIRIQAALESDDLEFVEGIWRYIRDMRKAGLEASGEMSVENIAYKTLRANGLVRALFDHIIAIKDQQLSLESVNKPE